MEKTLKKFRCLIANNFFINPQAVNYKKSFQKDLRLSESEFIAMIAYTENAFQVQIADNEVPNMRFVQDIVKYIDSSHQHKNYI